MKNKTPKDGYTAPTEVQLVASEAQASKIQTDLELQVSDPSPEVAQAAIAEAVIQEIQADPVEVAMAVYARPGVRNLVANLGLVVPGNLSDQEVFDLLSKGKLLLPARIREEMGL